MGSVAPAVVGQAAVDIFPAANPLSVNLVPNNPSPVDSAPKPSPLEMPPPAANQGDVRGAVLTALANAGQRMLSAMLEAGDWRVEGNELLIKVAFSNTVIEMSLGADAKRLIVATASGVLGRAIRLKVVSGEVSQSGPRISGSTNGGGRGRAEQDPVVHRMKEKFGAEIRTIIDYKEKR